ncbi:hypothetical protein F5Y05DRAFT_388369 [Hypoxylon sp. FL0543]|nr:hypothetical protein F5Y05DRAFT_388369 [Hypoxylon sp. FL0543]
MNIAHLRQHYILSSSYSRHILISTPCPFSSTLCPSINILPLYHLCETYPFSYIIPFHPYHGPPIRPCVSDSYHFFLLFHTLESMSRFPIYALLFTSTVPCIFHFATIPYVTPPHRRCPYSAISIAVTASINVKISYIVEIFTNGIFPGGSVSGCTNSISNMAMSNIRM